MKLCVVSDSHGNKKALAELAKRLHNQVDEVIHLGDESTDVDVIRAYEINCITVPGIYEPGYLKNDIANRLLKSYGSVRLLLTHTLNSQENDLPGDLKPEDIIHTRSVDLILYGHTHIPALNHVDDILYINPGHLNENDRRGYPLSYALIEIIDNLVSVSIVEFPTAKIIFQYP